MPNIPALIGLVQTLVRPGLIVPHAVVRDISVLDWTALHRAGVRHIVCDKDNCLTKPHDDALSPALSESWAHCRHTFGAQNVLIVSNSAGSSDDSGGIGAENLSRELQVPVLAHAAKKPARSCARQIIDFFDPKGHILVIGDRPTTDVVLAYRIDSALQRRNVPKVTGAGAAADPSGLDAAASSLVGAASLMQPRAFGILTTNLWQSEKLGTRTMRAMENGALRLLAHRQIAPGAGWSKGSLERQASPEWLGVAVRRASAPGISSTPSPSSATSFKAEDSPRLLALLVAQPSLPSWFRTSLRGLLSIVRTTPARWLSAHLSRGWGMVGEGVTIGTDARLRRGALLSSGTMATRGRVLGMPPKNSRGYATSAKGKPQVKSKKQKFAAPAPAPAPAPRPRTRATKATPPSLPPSSPLPPPASVEAAPEQAGPSAPRKINWKGWGAAVAALIILPVGWFGGLLLNEKMNEGKEEAQIDQAVEELVPQDEIEKLESVEYGGDRTEQGPTDRERREHIASLEREVYHLTHELKDNRAKQEVLKVRRTTEQEAAAKAKLV